MGPHFECFLHYDDYIYHVIEHNGMGEIDNIFKEWFIGHFLDENDDKVIERKCNFFREVLKNILEYSDVLQEFNSLEIIAMNNIIKG